MAAHIQTYKVGPGPEDLIKVVLGDEIYLLTGTAGKKRLGKCKISSEDPLRAKIPDSNVF